MQDIILHSVQKKMEYSEGMLALMYRDKRSKAEPMHTLYRSPTLALYQH